MGGSTPHPFSNAFTSPKLKSLRYNTAQRGGPIAVCYGTRRVAVNVIEGYGFTAGSGGKKGGGKGGGAKKSGSATYSVFVDFALCEGPISYYGAPFGIDGDPMINRVWSNGGVAGINDIPVNLYVGDDGQDPDPTFAADSGNVPPVGYSGTAHITVTPMDLGSSPVLPNLQVEITGFGAGTAGDDFKGDARFDWVLIDLLTDSRHGIGYPIDNLDCGGGYGGGGSVGDWGDYCQALGLTLSILCDRQQVASRWISDMAELTNTAIVCTGPLLRMIPYGDGYLSAHGATWTPDLTWRYSLTSADFLPWAASSDGSGTDPLLISRIDPSQVANWMGAEFENVANSYNTEVVPVFDQVLIDQYGVRDAPSVQVVGLTHNSAAYTAVQLQLQRKDYVRSRYKFKLGWRYSLLEPMDIVLLTDATIGFDGAGVRIVQIDEDENGELTVTAEEIPGITP